MSNQLPQGPFLGYLKHSAIAVPIILLMMMSLSAAFGYRFSIGAAGVIFEKDYSQENDTRGSKSSEDIGPDGNKGFDQRGEPG